MSGLEAGHMDVFDSYSGATVSAAQVRTGSYSLSLGAVNHWALAALPANISEVFGRFAIRANYTSFYNLGNTLMTLYDSIGGTQITIQLHYYTGLVQVRRGDHSGTILGIGGELHQNRWHCVEFRLVVDDAAGVFQLKVDGTQVINFAGDTQATANANVRSFRIGWNDTAHAALGYLSLIHI